MAGQGGRGMFTAGGVEEGWIAGGKVGGEV